MLELAARLLPLLERGVPVAVATAIDVTGSSPNGVGTSMALPAGGAPIGSVSGGCVEAAALADCRAVLAGGPAVVRRYGFGAAGAPGLACGGEVDVLTCLLPPSAEVPLRAAVAGRPAALALITTGPAERVGLPADDTDRQVRVAVEGALGAGRPGGCAIECDGVGLRVFVDVAAPRPRLALIGGTETAAALAAAAAAVGFVVTVCDPRAAFAVPARFPAAHTVVAGRPHEVLAGMALGPADAVCLLSHDEDLDGLALAAALESPAGYVGALGSRATTARRVARLAALGVGRPALARLHAPIGLDIGARTPAEVAVSVVAELIAVRTGALAAPLREGAGPIHRPIAAG